MGILRYRSGLGTEDTAITTSTPQDGEAVPASAAFLTAAVEPRLTIPPIIRRNSIYLALSQAFVGAGTQMIPTLGPLVVVYLLGSAALAGIATSILGLSRLLVAYPVGRITDTHGRRPGIVLGLGLGVIGACVMGVSILAFSFAMFIVGMVVFGMGMGAVQQLRVAAADMYPPSLRAQGLGLVLTGSVAGALGGPLLIAAATKSSSALGAEPLGMAWLLVPAVLIPGMVLVAGVRPDPAEIAGNLSHYYPRYRALPEPVAGTAVPTAAEDAARVTLLTFVRHFPKRVAFVCSFAAHGNMAMMMSLTAISLHHHGHGLSAISLAVAIHVVGMFGLSLPIGRLADDVGRRGILGLGLIISAAGTALITMTPHYWVITAGAFLVGVGWSGVNIAATALIADTTRPLERGRAIGANDIFAGAASISLPLAGGAVAEYYGLPVLGVLGVALMAPPLLLLTRLRAPSPGVYRS